MRPLQAMKLLQLLQQRQEEMQLLLCQVRSADLRAIITVVRMTVCYTMGVTK
jgi:hypothetical protein